MSKLTILSKTCFSAGIAALALSSATCLASPAAPALSLSLADAVRLVRQTSLSVAEAREDANLAAADSRSAVAGTKLSISTTTYATAGDESSIVASAAGVAPQNILAVPSRGFADQNVFAMAPIFTGEKLSAQVEAARLQTIAAQDGIRAAELAAQSDVIQAYAQALLAQQLLIVAHSKVVAEEDQVKITQDRVNVGSLAPEDLLREQAELADARQAELSAGNDAAVAIVNLKTVLGLDLASGITLTDTLDTALAQPSPVPPSLDFALSHAAKLRPELMQANAQAAASDAGIQAAKGAYSPQVYGVGMADASVMDGGDGTGFTVGVMASIPLYDAGERQADVDAARARSERSRTDRLKEQQTIAQQVSIAWLNYQTAVAQIDDARAGIQAASEAYRLADLRYNAGKSTSADRLDALAARTRAEGTLAEAEARVVATRGVLLASVGEDAGAGSAK